MDLNKAYQEDSTVATSESRCRTMYEKHCHLLPTSIFFCGAFLQYLVYLVLIVIIFFRLRNHDNRIKTSVCIITFSWLSSIIKGIFLIFTFYYEDFLMVKTYFKINYLCVLKKCARKLYFFTENFAYHIKKI